jgi:hypothetical protein
VAIIGLGSGSSRPTLTFGTANTANIPITAADMSIQNFLFKANFAAVVSVFTATSTNTPTDFSVERCEFRDGALAQLHLDRHRQRDGQQHGRPALRRQPHLEPRHEHATTAIKIASDTDRVTIQDNYGNWAVLNNTAAACSRLARTGHQPRLRRNVCSVRTPARPAVRSSAAPATRGPGTATTTTCTRWTPPPASGSPPATERRSASQHNFSPITGAADKSGLINPAAA